MSLPEQEFHFPRRVFAYPKLTPAVKAILLVNVGCFILQAMSPEFMARYFALHPDEFFRGVHVWQIATAMFLHGSLLHILLNMFVLAFSGFGPGLERFMGTRRFCAVYLISGVGGNALFLAANVSGTIPVLGASGGVCGVLAAYAMAFPERWVLLLLPPMPAKVKWLVLVFFGIEVLSELGHGGGSIAHSAHVGGFIFGWAYMKIVYKLSLPFAWIERLKWKTRRFFGGVSLPRLSFRRRPPERKYRPLDDDSFIDKEVDPILEKVSKYGIHSLTADERRILKRAHDRMGKG
jgi:membrane associated rhomboid family serine protease